MISALAPLIAPVAAAAVVQDGAPQRPITVGPRFVPAVTVEVWLPPGYGTGRRYPVLDMMDGQNVFDTPAATRVYVDYGTTYGGVIGRWQARRDAAASQAGRHWQSTSGPGDAHTESAWAGRVHVPLVWLVGPRVAAAAAP